MPYTPSAAKVFRSAWMPAPPPESEPAIVSARGMSAPAKVIPSRRFDRSLVAVRVDCDEATLGDLADVGELHAEPLVELGARGLDGRRSHPREELVILAALQR